MKRKYERNGMGIGAWAVLLGVTPNAVWKERDKGALVRRRVHAQLDRLARVLAPASRMPKERYAQLAAYGLRTLVDRAQPILGATDKDLWAKHKTTRERLIHDLASLLGVVPDGGLDPMILWKRFLKRMWGVLQGALNGLVDGATTVHRTRQAVRSTLVPEREPTYAQLRALSRGRKLRWAPPSINFDDIIPMGVPC